VKWYRKAAEHGHDSAQFNLGWCFMNGRGVAKDPVEAVKWYRMAAEQENAKAQFQYGKCLERGRGISQDVAQAVRFFRLAAKQGFPKAELALGICYARGDGVPEDHVQARRWLTSAANHGEQLASQALLDLTDGRTQELNTNLTDQPREWTPATVQTYGRAMGIPNATKVLEGVDGQQLIEMSESFLVDRGLPSEQAKHLLDQARRLETPAFQILLEQRPFLI
jgi:TPR repeat protein